VSRIEGFYYILEAPLQFTITSLITGELSREQPVILYYLAYYYKARVSQCRIQSLIGIRQRSPCPQAHSHAAVQ
jgi:hypothetical protein